MKEYNRARVYLDENYKSQEHFTVSRLSCGVGPRPREPESWLFLKSAELACVLCHSIV